MPAPHSPPVVLTIAGSDCSAGAGVQADLKTFGAFGCYGLTALTAIVAETPAVVVSIQMVDPQVLEDQVRVLAEAYPIAAVKTGMLGGREQVEAVIRAWAPLAARQVPLVVDPVMVATSGGRLLEEDAVQALIQGIFPLAAIITPNLDEGAVLWDRAISTRQEMELAARELSRQHGCSVLLKGGHLPSEDEVPDLLLEAAGDLHWLEGRRVKGVHTHGTGCTFSAAIAAGLARGRSTWEAVRDAKAFVGQCIAEHFRWGTVDALHHLRNAP